MADEEKDSSSQDTKTLELDSRTILNTYEPDGTTK
jgi:hypothetical protein